MIRTFIFCLVALAVLCFTGTTHANPEETEQFMKPISAIMGTKMTEAYRVPKARNFCHAGYGVCPDSHCCPMGGECCDTPGTCCPRDYYCMGTLQRTGCCPNGQKCKF
ncbi:unnamed protein product [Absidia cylindrospora]